MMSDIWFGKISKSWVSWLSRRMCLWLGFMRNGSVTHARWNTINAAPLRGDPSQPGRVMVLGDAAWARRRLTGNGGARTVLRITG